MTYPTGTPTTTPAHDGRLGVIACALATHHVTPTGTRCRCGHEYRSPGDVTLHHATAVEAALTLHDAGVRPEQLLDTLDAVMLLIRREAVRTDPLPSPDRAR